MTTQVRRLEDAGLVTRTVDPIDARAVLIEITDTGVRTLDRVRADRAAVVNPLLEQLDGADQATLSEAVDILHRVLAQAQSSLSISEPTR